MVINALSRYQIPGTYIKVSHGRAKLPAVVSKHVIKFIVNVFCYLCCILFKTTTKDRWSFFLPLQDTRKLCGLIKYTNLLFLSQVAFWLLRFCLLSGGWEQRWGNHRGLLREILFGKEWIAWWIRTWWKRILHFTTGHL